MAESKQTATSTTAGDNATPVVTSPTTESAAAEPLLNKQEIVELRKEMRETRDAARQIVAKAEKPSESTKPADPMEERVNQRLAELDFREALADAGIAGAQRELLREAWVGVGRPTANIGEWIKQRRGALAGSAPTETASTTQSSSPAALVAAVPVPVVPGAAPGALDGDPRGWPPEVLAKKSGLEIRQAIEAYDVQTNPGSKILAAFREQRARMDANREQHKKKG